MTPPVTLARRVRALEAQRAQARRTRALTCRPCQPPDLPVVSIRLAVQYLADAGYFDERDEAQDEQPEPAAG